MYPERTIFIRDIEVFCTKTVSVGNNINSSLKIKTHFCIYKEFSWKYLGTVAPIEECRLSLLSHLVMTYLLKYGHSISISRPVNRQTEWARPKLENLNRSSYFFSAHVTVLYKNVLFNIHQDPGFRNLLDIG